jgi:hypothetical protein
MSADSRLHAPSAEFRASLEGEIVRALRRETSFDAPARARDRFRSVALLTAGLLFGVGVQFASAQVGDARQRSELERAAEVERGVAALRLDLARTAHERARQRVEIGAISRQLELEAAAEVRLREMELARLHYDLEEIRASAGAPRDELWAPLVGRRDFVRQRLTVRAVASQQRLTLAEARAAEAERGFRAGVVSAHALGDAQAEAAQAKQEFQVLAQKLMLRDEFLKSGLPSEEVTRRIQRIELRSEMERAIRQLELARVRVDRARRQSIVGVADELEVKRAELEVLEQTVRLDRLRTALRMAEAREK